MAWLSLVGVVTCGGLAGCGGDDSATISGDAGDEGSSADATNDTSRSDTGTDAKSDAKPSDSGSDATDGGGSDASDGGSDDANDAAVACSPDGSACMSGTSADLCKAGVCSPCVDTTDDTACASAYADGGATGFICQGAQCIAGNCHTDAQCTVGQICGVTTANLCGPCANDLECKNDTTYGTSFVCDTTMGLCVSSACMTPNAPCTTNTGDECCAVTSTTSACVAGDCCTNAQCTGTTPACQNHACTACDAIANNTYYVDPVNGSDLVASTGSGQAGGTANGVCAFKTITRAMAILGVTPPANTKVIVLGPSTVSTASNGETFPITVPVNVTVSGQGAVVVNVLGGLDGFHLGAANSGLTLLTLDGSQTNDGGTTNTGLRGIVASTGSALTTTVGAITVQNFLDAGIRVQATGVLSITAGTHVLSNGTAAAPRPGLHVTDTGLASIASTTDSIQFNNNTLSGILVDTLGSVKITGTPGTAGAGTVVANGNAFEGIDIAQTYSGTPPFPPLNDINGVVAWQSGRNGLRLRAGSSVKVRNSYILAGASNGVLVTNAGSLSNDISRIDLGQATVPPDYGQNIVQDTVNPNNDVGICLSLTNTLGATLNAAGNIFATTKNCATTPAVLTKNQCATGTKFDIGIANAQSNTLVTYQCTHP